MASPKARKDKIFEKVINPYLAGVLQHPQSIDMREGVLHIRDVEGAKKNESMEARLEAMEQHVFKCQGMVEHGLNANHMMITEFTNKHKIDANDIRKHLSRLYDRIDHLQAQIYDLQNQNLSCPAPQPDNYARDDDPRSHKDQEVSIIFDDGALKEDNNKLSEDGWRMQTKLWASKAELEDVNKFTKEAHGKVKMVDGVMY
ncbi:40S ribosomal protein S5-1 [Hordeum vulgare]|nr:40S ribosomal protein S5-1 [Hordeum vulgare]